MKRVLKSLIWTRQVLNQTYLINFQIVYNVNNNYIWIKNDIFIS